jgi:hypothetical protein
VTDYSQIPIPDDKPPEEYGYNERRAEILQLIEQKGHPWGFNYSQLGRRYGVSHETIRKDFARLKDWYQDRIGGDAKTASDLAYRRIVQEHMDNGDYEKARRALDSWNGWLQDTGEQASEPEQVEVSGEDGGALEVAINREVRNDDDGD